MATREWTASYESAPAGTDSISGGDDQIRNLKVDVRERLANGGHYVQDAVAPWSKDGRHYRGAASPTWYKADATTPLLEPTSDTEITCHENLVVDGAINRPSATNDYVFSSATITSGALPVTLNSTSHTTSSASRNRLIEGTVSFGREGATTGLAVCTVTIDRKVGGGAWTTVRTFQSLGGFAEASAGVAALATHKLQYLDTFSVAAATTLEYRLQMTATLNTIWRGHSNLTVTERPQ